MDSIHFLLFITISYTITSSNAYHLLFTKSDSKVIGEEPCDVTYKLKNNNNPTNQNSSISCTPSSTNCPRLSQCYESFCICWMGYEWDPGSASCRSHHCSADFDCYSYYPHTRCVDAVCVCDDVSRFCPINQACVYLPDSAHYLIAILSMAAAFVAISVAASALTYCWTRRKYRKRKETMQAGQREGLVRNGSAAEVANYQTISTVKSGGRIYPEI